MIDLPEPKPNVSPLLIAGLCLAAIEHLRRLELPHPTGSAIIESTGVSRASAYEYREKINAMLPELQRPPGRPVQERATGSALVAPQLTQAVLRFLIDNPGGIHGGPIRQRYGDAFRHFILELRDKHCDMELAAFADAVYVPLGTLEDWLRNKPAAASGEQREPTPDAVTIPRIESIIAAWKRWDGTFIDFCAHVQTDLRVTYGRSMIARILEEQGVRLPRRRPGTEHTPDEKALRGSFETFFSGAQWVGDGKQVSVTINGETFTFNWELNVDAHSAAFVGASVRDEEDSAAVVEAFQDGVRTTGAPPLAELLDNRASNHTAEVDAALGNTIRMRSTLGRAQNKAHVEGTFGLFAQTVPALEINASSLKDLARQVAVLVVATWARLMNHRPRLDRKGATRVEIYKSDQATPEEIAQATAAFKERCRKQELAEATRQARQDPLVRKALDDAFLRLEVLDPDGNTRSAIAGFPLDAVLAGIATFDGKRAANTLPPDADAGRYLMGIVRNIVHEDEGMKIAAALLKERMAARDHGLALLRARREAITCASSDPIDQLKGCIDEGLSTTHQLDQLFWLDSAAAIISGAASDATQALWRQAMRRIYRSYRTPYSQRLAAVRAIAAKVIPLE